MAALRDGGGATPVLDFMLRDIPSVPADSPLEPAFQILQRRQSPVVAVMAGEDKLAGYIELQNLGELFLLRSGQRQTGNSARKCWVCEEMPSFR